MNNITCENIRLIAFVAVSAFLLTGCLASFSAKDVNIDVCDPDVSDCKPSDKEEGSSNPE